MGTPGAPTRIVSGELPGGGRWEVAIRRPPAPLRPYVRDLMGYVERTPAPLARRELPIAQVVVILELGPPIRIDGTRYPGGFVAGLDDRPTLCVHDGHQAGLQLNLTPLGARLFFGLPMAELAGRVVSLADLVARPHRRLAETLEALPGWEARFELLERLLLERLAIAPAPRTAIVAHAVRAIEAAGGAVDVAGLARRLGYSQKHVIDLFRDQVGVAPKLLARLVRFERLVGRLRAGERPPWSRLAAELGFYDQAHLVREVRHFAATTPTALRAEIAGETFNVNFVQDPDGAEELQGS